MRIKIDYVYKGLDIYLYVNLLKNRNWNYNSKICLGGTCAYFIDLNFWKDRCWSWNSSTLATWWEELTHLKRPWCWERLRAGGEGDDRRLDGWRASPTQWTCVWVDCKSWWWTGRPGMLQFMGAQRVGHDWATELTDWYYIYSSIILHCYFTCVSKGFLLFQLLYYYRVLQYYYWKVPELVT